MKNKKDQLGKEYDIAIIGGGVVGGMIAYHLAKYRSRIVILEKESDAAMGQSKANSGIVHAGYDPQPGSLKAILKTSILNFTTADRMCITTLCLQNK